MVLSLLLQINEEPSVKGKEGGDLDTGLTAMLKDHQVKLAERQKQVIEAIKKIEEEDKKKITSDSLKEGWNSGVGQVDVVKLRESLCVSDVAHSVCSTLPKTSRSHQR
jgi:cell division cycle protein 37